MTTLQQRRTHFLFRLALVSVLTLGAAQVILDNLRNNLLISGSSEKYRVIMPIEVSSEESIEDGCNVFEGKWVWDNESHPLYREESCEFLVKQTSCLRNGRKDSLYQNWRWQPHACNLPRYLLNSFSFLILWTYSCKWVESYSNLFEILSSFEIHV